MKKESAESKGVRAIIALQKVAGIDEPKDKARAAWRKMTKEQRAQTMLAHAVVCK